MISLTKVNLVTLINVATASLFNLSLPYHLSTFPWCYRASRPYRSNLFAARYFHLWRTSNDVPGWFEYSTRVPWIKSHVEDRTNISVIDYVNSKRTHKLTHSFPLSSPSRTTRTAVRSFSRQKLFQSTTKNWEDFPAAVVLLPSNKLDQIQNLNYITPGT